MFNEVGRTVIFSVDVYSNTDCRLVIFDQTTIFNNSSVFIPANTPGTYQVTRTISDNAIYEWYRVSKLNAVLSDWIYVDNWRLEII